MAVPPGVPTAFVPRQSFGGSRRPQVDFGGAFAFACYGILILTAIAAVGVFIYGRILDSERGSKDQELATAESNIDPATVESFVRLQNRLTQGKQLLDNHIVASNVFAFLEKAMVTNTRFSSLEIHSGDKLSLTIAGVAKSFNALAAESNSLSGANLKDVIFSGLHVGIGGLVSFSLTGTIDPSLSAFTVSGATPAPASGTTTSP